MKNTALALAGLMSSTVLVAPASAAIIISNSPGFVQPAENVLLNNGQTGATVTGTTNQTNTSVTFQSLNGETLTAPSNGQARVETTDGSLDALRFSLTNPSLGFTQAEFNLFNAFANTSSVAIMINGGATQTFNLTNGQNFFGVSATGGDLIRTISFDTNGLGVADLRQVRLGGFSTAVAAVPEPATWAMMLVGFGAIGVSMRRRRRAGSNALSTV